MKNLKIKLTIISSLILCSLFLNSCETESSEEFNQSFKKEFLSFKSSFPELANKIDYKSIQETSAENNGKSMTKTSGVSFPIINNNKIIGRYIATIDERSAVYIDFSDYQNKIIIYDVNNPSKFESFEMVLNEKSNTYSPVYNSSLEKGFWCDAQCTLAAIAIAASDGPAPLMDILAISFQITCLASCRE
ncbi:hypothetical protein ACFQ0R_02275 [Psychroflexus salinarum]|uniref:Lipoprotein n=1 Tax=Psychroflexus salinarum TaxID=546024 RepID=A0ABW3GLC4_9FLAO